MTIPNPDNTQQQLEQELMKVDPLTRKYIEARLVAIRQEIFDEIMSTVMDNLKPLQDQVASLGNTSRKGSALKLNPPNPYDGSRESGEAFAKSCVLHFQLRPDDFPDLDAQIGWVLSFMDSGRAQEWRNDVLTHFTDHGKYKWTTLYDFQAEFAREFLPIAEQEEAIVTLEGRTYFQKSSESVDAYVDRFRSLVKKANLADGSSVVIKFRRGLQESLAQTLSDSANPPPANDIDQWITRSRNLERSRNLQKSISGAKPSLPASKPNFFSSFRARPTDSIAPPQRSVSTPTRPPGISFVPRPPAQTPMDLDAARARSQAPSTVCHRCKQPGHWAKDCPRQYDVRMLSVDELEGFLAMARDTEALQERAAQEEEDEPEEGFGSTSG